MKHRIVSMSLVGLLSITVLNAFAASDNIMLDRAQQFIRQGKFESARQIYEKLLKTNNHEPAVYNNLASIYARQGRLDDAKRLLEQGIGTHEQYSVLLENLTAVNVAMARESYSKALELKLNNSTVELALLEAPLQLVAKAPASRPVSIATNHEITAGQTEVAEQPPVAKPEKQPAEKTAEPAPVVVASVAEPEVKPAQPEPTQPEVVTPAAEDKTPVKEVSVVQQKPVDPVQTAAVKKAGQGVSLASRPDIAMAITMLQDWATAWSEKDIEHYIGYYTDNYTPEAGVSHGAWRAQRKQRIARPAWIKVKLDKLEVTASSEDSVTIRLLQEYRASNYNDVTTKQFVLVNTPRGWLIRSESSL